MPGLLDCLYRSVYLYVFKLFTASSILAAHIHTFIHYKMYETASAQRSLSRCCVRMRVLYTHVHCIASKIYEHEAYENEFSDRILLKIYSFLSLSLLLGPLVACSYILHCARMWLYVYMYCVQVYRVSAVVVQIAFATFFANTSLKRKLLQSVSDF